MHDLVYVRLSSESRPVTVLYNPNLWRGASGVSEKARFEVWGVSAGRNVIRSYEQTREASIDNSKLGFLFGCVMLPFGILSAASAYRRKRQGHGWFE